MLKMYTIEELVKIVNEKLNSNKDNTIYSDGRVSNEITIRKVRDLLSKDLINNPVKDGRQNYFDDSHVEQILNIKKFQKEGVTEKLLRNISSTSQVNNIEDYQIEASSKMQHDALQTLAAINANSLGSAVSGNMKIQSQGATESRAIKNLDERAEALLNGHLTKASISYADSYRNGMKVVNEFPLDTSGKIHLKMEQGYNAQNKEEILERIKQILGIGDKS